MNEQDDLIAESTSGQTDLSLKALNERHGRNSDIYAGARSRITGFKAYKRGTVYLDLHVDDQLSKPLRQIVRNIAKSWRCEPELCFHHVKGGGSWQKNRGKTLREKRSNAHHFKIMDEVRPGA